MKKMVLLALMSVLVLVFAGCRDNSKPQGMADATYDIGIQALEALDKYLDGAMNVRQLDNALGELHEKIQALNFTDRSESTNNVLVSSSISHARDPLISIMFDDGFGNPTDVIDSRNKLAELLEKEARE